ncbi:helix-turn-helix domain-containing protein [Catenulispora pinisilvae]|uniref:helix-turn-helix domain-containing protein n=1 Tax=Catenulispora pinisilvae TaxID=2705253 RepID=UPI00189251AC|nr:helix-turn-helix transcriptional regulator [Catenulispora pinisilvae]
MKHSTAGESGDGPCLRGIREAADLNLKKAAERVGYTVGHLSNVETGKRGASAELMRRYDGLRYLPSHPPSADRHGGVTSPDSHGQGDRGADDFGILLMRLRLEPMRAELAEEACGISRHCDPAELLHNGYQTLRRLRATAQGAGPYSVLFELSQSVRLISAAATLLSLNV